MTDLEKNTLLLQWLRLNLSGRTLRAFMEEKGFQNIAVCGYREYGRLLVKQMMMEDIEPVCIIEKNYQSLQVIENIKIPIIGFDSEFDWSIADVIIVTPDLDLVQVRENLEMSDIRVPMLGLHRLLMERI